MVFPLALVFVGNCGDTSRGSSPYPPAFAAPPPISKSDSLTNSTMPINFIVSPIERRGLTEAALHPVSFRTVSASITSFRLFLPSNAGRCELSDSPTSTFKDSNTSCMGGDTSFEEGGGFYTESRTVSCKSDILYSSRVLLLFQPLLQLLALDIFVSLYS